MIHPYLPSPPPRVPNNPDKDGWIVAAIAIALFFIIGYLHYS